MGNSNSANLKSNSSASFHSIFEEIYTKNNPDSGSQLDEKMHSESTAHFEWVSVIESAQLLNRLFENDLRYTAKVTAPAQAAYAKMRSTKFHTTPPEPETVINSENPAWTTEAKQAFVSINTLPTKDSTITQHKLPVFFTSNELKKIYRERAKLTHPDLHGGSHTQFIELKKNCQILMDFSKKID